MPKYLRNILVSKLHCFKYTNYVLEMSMLFRYDETHLKYKYRCQIVEHFNLNTDSVHILCEPNNVTQVLHMTISIFVSSQFQNNE